MKLFKASIYHKRFFPRLNEFTYSGFYIKFSLDEIESLKNSLFSVNRFNLFSFYEKDHGKRDGSSLREWVSEMLTSAGLEPLHGKIYLQTFPRVLGHVFNPVSFLYCYQGEDLKAIICEVNNTFGETHSYVLTQNLDKEVKSLKKEFHVSPFYDIKGKYEFNFTRENFVGINYYFDEKLQLVTSIKGKSVEWNTLNFFKFFMRYPLYSFMVISLIHYQALRLFLKKCTFYSKPEKIERELTFGDN